MSKFLNIYKRSTWNKFNFNITFNHNYYHSGKGVFGCKPKLVINEKIPQSIISKRNEQSLIYRWVEAFRKHGHRIACINPIEIHPNNRDSDLNELHPHYYGLIYDDKINLTGILYGHSSKLNNNNNNSCSNNNNNKNNKSTQHTNNISSNNILTVSEVEILLKEIYSSEKATVEFNYIENEYEREWVAEEFEKIFATTLNGETKKEIAQLLIKSQCWDLFLATKFPSVKRYGGEGAESMLAFFRQLFLSSAEAGIQNVILGMPHRGKLNLLTTMLETRPAKIFRKFKGQPEFLDDTGVMCDIASHFHSSLDLEYNNQSIHLSMLHNPSHLEAVNPVTMGKTLSKQQLGESAISIIGHGDAAFPGQGINQECLLMSKVPHYDVDGSIHIIVNNQVGFTTPGDRGRCTRYASDLAKSINAPIFHVNGDDPEILTAVTKIAFNYRQRFQKDVFIDLNCFRRWGHNEMDDPTFTNPALYQIIQNRLSVPDMYANKLIAENVMEENEINEIKTNHMSFLASELQNWESYVPENSYYQKQWQNIQQASNTISTWDTGLDYSLLHYIGKCSVEYPSTFTIHSHLQKHHVNSRLKKLDEGNNIDWATAESLAIGSLMYQGHNVRISGEDVGRGTFSQRHAMLVDQKTNELFIPLNEMKGGLGGRFEVANSTLSEEAVLGFEYGMSIDNPNNLIIWEAQFGDFFNGAQIIFDTFIMSGETKWMRANGLVMVLPHGYDGAASEHSSSKLERFLQMTDSKETSPDGENVNVNIIYPTTPAQYFHALRRQIIRNFRKPLIVVGPKTLLRLSEATSNHSEFQPGTHFHNVLGDIDVEPNQVRKVILCSGKHYYNLDAERHKRRVHDVAIIRIEALCPFPCHELQIELNKYKNANEFIWSQEEHRNMGAWTFIRPRFENLLGRKIKYCGRYEAATPAVGVSSWHAKEAVNVIMAPFE